MTYVPKTTLQQLEELDNAITGVMEAQSYTFKDRTVTRADLDQLYSMRSKLMTIYEREQSGRRGPTVRYGSFYR